MLVYSAAARGSARAASFRGSIRPPGPSIPVPLHLRRRRGAALLPALLALAACETPTREEPPPVELRPTAAELLSGDLQRGLPGAVLAQPVAVRVLAGTTPVAGVTVRFAGERPGALTPAEALTDQQGIARATWTLDRLGMVQTAQATVPVLQQGFPLTAHVDSMRTVWVQAPHVVAPGEEFEVALWARMDSVPMAPMGPNQVLIPQNAGLVSGTLRWDAGPFEFVGVRGGRIFPEIERATLVAVPGAQGVAVTAMEPRAPVMVGGGRVWVARLRAGAARGRYPLTFELRDFLSARQFASAREHLHVVGAEVTVQ